MRVRIQHKITSAYETPAQFLVQILRLTPRNHDGQFVRRWQIDTDADVVLKAREDAFGNISHLLSLAGPVTGVTFTIEGEVETHDTQGVVAGAHERFPTRLYLRETDLTHPEAGLADFARDAGGEGSPLDRLHALLTAVHDFIDVEPAVTAHAVTTASEALVLRKGSAEDAAQVFVAGARCMGIPARYISGYVASGSGGATGHSHGWGEAFVDGLGWVGFDPANCLCVTDAYVRVSVGLDYLGAAPIRSVHTGPAVEKRSVAVTVNQAQAQGQRQT